MDDSISDAVRAAVRAAFETEQVPLLARLVDHPGASREPERVERAMGVFDAEAESLGLSIARLPDEAGRFADHRLYATPRTDDSDHPLLLVGHMDTVFPQAAGDRPFAREGDVVRGPGVLDMKSGLSLVVAALRAVSRAAPDAWSALRARVLVVSDEEVASPSSRSYIETLAESACAALVFEHGRDGDRLVTRRKGTGSFRFTVHGRAAHAGLHHEAGVNAIHALALLVDAIEAVTDTSRGVTVNVGLIDGGTATNTVPARAACSVDVRYETAEGGAYIEAELGRIAKTPLPGRLAAARIELEGGLARPPMEPADGTEALVRRYEHWAAGVGLGTGVAPRQGGGSDANLVAARGTPCIDGLGPRGANPHREDEWASLESLEKRTEALACFLAAHALGG